MRKFLTALLFVFATSLVAQAQVTGTIGENGLITVVGEGVQAAGLDFQSPAGNLVPVPDPPGSGPFTFFLSNTANQITWGNLGTTVELGTVETGAGYNGDPTGDLKTFWGNGPVPEEFPTTRVVVEPGDDGPGDDGGDDTGDDGGVAEGPVKGEVRGGFIVITTTEPIQAAGLDFQSAGGLLVPVPEATGSAPFTFFLANTANQITWGNLGTTVTIDGELATAAGYTGGADVVASDLQTFWGNGPVPTAFPTTVIPEPTSGMLAVFAALGFLGFRKRR